MSLVAHRFGHFEYLFWFLQAGAFEKIKRNIRNSSCPNWWANVLGSSSAHLLMCRSWNFEYYVIFVKIYFMFTFYWENKFLIGQRRKHWPIIFFSVLNWFWGVETKNHNKYLKFQLWYISKSADELPRTKI